MIKKLKRRFIITAMLSVMSVLLLIIGSINTVSYLNILDSAQTRLDMIASGTSRFPSTDFFGGQINIPFPEAAFDTRYFSVCLDESGNVIHTDTTNISAINHDTAVKMASKLFTKGRQKGITDTYAYKVYEQHNHNTYVFLDQSREISTFVSFLAASLLFSLIALGLVFVLVLLFSKPVINPVIESYEKQKRFITDAGHELKTPLTVISAANEVIEIENGESQWTKSIERQVLRLTELTNKLVMLSRMSEENGLICSRFSLSEALSDCVMCFQAVEYAKDKEIQCNIQEGIEIQADEKAISQLFSILTDNALKYSPEGSVIFISLRRISSKTEILFINPATDIPMGNNDILLERFYRHDNSRNSQTGGHGIGLASAKAIVDAHKGKISVENPDGRSFVVKIIL